MFFLASIVTSGVNIVQFNEVLEENAPDALADRTEGYRKEEKVEEFRGGEGTADLSNSSWHVVLYLKGLNWTLMALIVFLFIIRKRLELISSSYLSCLSFSMLFWGVANLMNSLPSGSRFFAVASLAVLPLIILYIQNTPNEKYLSRKVLFLSPALLLFSIVSIRMGFYFFSINTFISNPVIALFLKDNLALNDLIK